MIGFSSILSADNDRSINVIGSHENTFVLRLVFLGIVIFYLSDVVDYVFRGVQLKGEGSGDLNMSGL